MAGAGESGTGLSAVLSKRARLLAIEHAAVRAWPAGETRDVDGWLWRYSGGGSQRANSVSALNYRGTNVERTIDAIEQLYRERAAPVRFQVGFPLSEPDDLDARLEARGYVIHDPVTTLVKPVAAVAMPENVSLSATPSQGWRTVYLSNISLDRRPFAEAILARVPAPCVFAEARRNGETIATALGVLHENAVIAECVGTAASARRQGAASMVMSALEAWGAAQGARTIGLQAVTTNMPAQGLYAALGYTAAGTYHYRYLEEGSGR
jgi:ribosomal protein S18 acetylase RimI-like enzyme